MQSIREWQTGKYMSLIQQLVPNILYYPSLSNSSYPLMNRRLYRERPSPHLTLPLITSPLSHHRKDLAPFGIVDFVPLAVRDTGRHALHWSRSEDRSVPACLPACHRPWLTRQSPSSASGRLEDSGGYLNTPKDSPHHRCPLAPLHGSCMQFR